ncbi:MAG: hypothetical protein ABR973_00520 [Candidatus Acidiferrales bacterium]|jgi:hypothetical protein
MNTKLVAVAAILLASTLWLAGCTYVGLGGPPCYGFGCRAGLSAPSGKSSATQPGDGKTLTSNRPASRSQSGPKQGN